MKQAQAALGVHPLLCTDQILLFVKAGDQHKLLWSEAAAATTLELQK